MSSNEGLLPPFLTLDDVQVAYKNVLLRLDLNLPLQDGQVSDTTRIERCLPTIQELIEKKAKIIILSHLGRPKGEVKSIFSLKPVAEALREFVKTPVHFAPDCIGISVKKLVDQLHPGEILMLENLRFHQEEEANDPHFAQQLASLGDIFINDAFSCSHRAHASVVGVLSYLPSYGGRSMEAELKALTQVLIAPKHPVMAIVGGAKISTKLDLLSSLLSKMDYLVIGGGMANTFLKAQGYSIGASLVEDTMVATAAHILEQAEKSGCQIILPKDVLVTRKLAPHCSSETVLIHQVQHDQIIADVGPQTIQIIKETLTSCQTVIWNGPLGVFEIPPFDQSSLQLAPFIAQRTLDGLVSVAGGGDTLAALNLAGCGDQLTYTSTAGGAFLEWLEGKSLPGIEALKLYGRPTSSVMNQ